MTAPIRPAARQVQAAILAGEPSTLFFALTTLAEHVGRERAIAFARRLLRRRGFTV